VAELHKILATVKTALEAGAVEPNHPDGAPKQVPIAETAQRAELVSTFARELEAVDGHFLGILNPAETIARIAALAQELNARSAAIGELALADTEALCAALDAAGCSTVRASPVRNPEHRALMRHQMGNADLGIAEADFAIASTGTLAMVATENRPSALTLLPPASLILVRVDRLLPDLASALAALGPDTIARYRLTLITGPSRTADIEKRIVLGVHGPKALYAIVVWPQQ
jgi:L-lactate dehydrogenase complex protein LldG